MIFKTVKYEIPEDGICETCKARCFSCCQAFSKLLVIGMDENFKMTKREQCQECKDYLANQKTFNDEEITSKIEDLLDLLEVNADYDSDFNYAFGNIENKGEITTKLVNLFQTYKNTGFTNEIELEEQIESLIDANLIDANIEASLCCDYDYLGSLKTASKAILKLIKNRS